MNLSNLFRSSPSTGGMQTSDEDSPPGIVAASPFASREELVARYRRLRAASLRLNNAMVGRLSRDVVDEGATQLGLLRRGVLVFDSEDEMTVLMEHCVYDVRRRGRNAVEQFLLDSPPEPGSDEATCLHAMQHAEYSVFVVESVERGVGVVVRDLRSDVVRRIVDLGFGDTACPDLAFASRLLPFDGFWATSGAALPLGVVSAEQRADVTRTLETVMAPEDDGRCDPAPLIRACLANGNSALIRYQMPSGRSSGRMRPPSAGRLPSPHDERLRLTPAAPLRPASAARPLPPSRNSPCPCGSGKKFKHCCLKRG